MTFYTRHLCFPILLTKSLLKIHNINLLLLQELSADRLIIMTDLSVIIISKMILNFALTAKGL